MEMIQGSRATHLSAKLSTSKENYINRYKFMDGDYGLLGEY